MVEPLNKLIVLPDCGLEADIVETDANADELLYKNKLQVHQALPTYWARLTRRLGDKEKPLRADILQLREMDQVKLAIEIYRLSYGDRLVLGGDCPACDKPAGYGVDLEEMSDNIRLPDGVVGPDPLVEVRTPRTGHTVQVGFLKGDALLGEMLKSDVSLFRLELAHIRTVDGSPDIDKRDIASWPGRDHLAIREAVEEMRGWYETRKRFRHDCGREVVMNILTDPRFLFPAVPLRQ